MKNLLEKLMESGLSEKEAKVYLTVLKLGECLMTEISRESGIKRTTLYEYLKSLENRGLIYRSPKGKRLFYAPQKPEKIIKIIENQKKAVENIIPGLMDIYDSSSKKPKIKFYEGIDGLRQVYREMTKTSKTLWAVFSADKYFSVFSKTDGDEFVKNVYQSGGQLKDLVEDTAIGREYAKNNSQEGLGTTKVLPKDFSLSADILVAGNKVAINSMNNLAGLIIEDKDIANLQRQFIKVLWEQSRYIK